MNSTRLRFIFSVALAGLTVFGLSACGSGSDGAIGTGDSQPGTGIAGSQSRFAIIDDYLYTIAGSKLQIFDIQQPDRPSAWANVTVGFNIETTFGYNNHLFIGASDGVYIYDNTIPEFPEFLSRLAHRYACDPVVVQGNYAYVTLRAGARCGVSDNQLDVIDVTDLANPVLARTYPMQSPSGLGIDNNLLFVCDGIAGLKVFDATDPLQLSVLEANTSIDCYDVIPFNYNLVVSDQLGIMQYDYTNSPMEFVSEILVQ